MLALNYQVTNMSYKSNGKNDFQTIGMKHTYLFERNETAPL
jgi:hypothetical protein